MENIGIGGPIFILAADVQHRSSLNRMLKIAIIHRKHIHAYN
jgi:hypothetical protein